MNPEDDQQLWDILGRAAKPRISPFFARNILRQVRQEPVLSRGGTWLRLRILVPAAGVALALIAAVVFMRSSSTPQTQPGKEPEAVASIDLSKRVPEPTLKIDAPEIRAQASTKIDVATSQPEPVAKIDLPAKQPEPAAEKVDSQVNEHQALAQIDVQDYEVVANLDDLLVLYETSLWDENSSL